VSELQLYLLGGGAVFVAGVYAFNVWTERKARRKAEQAFGERPGDALFEAAESDRREPTLGAMPPAGIDETMPPVSRRAPAEELEAPGGPAAEVSSRIDTVAVILADDPIISEQLDPLLDALQAHTTPVHVEGIVDEQWHPVATSPKRSWRELRVGLQLASRSGPVGEEEIERFNRTIADFAAMASAVSQREAPNAAAVRARELDRFAASADIEVVINVVGQFGATFSIPRVKSLGLENGLSETTAGFMSYASDGSIEFLVRPLDDHHAKPGHTYTGLTFALDLPHVADPARVLAAMASCARTFARELGGELVDDNRKPLTEAGIASIRRSLDKILHDMQAHGIPAGGTLAKRLFS
jgi:hypothetical protein